MANPTNPLTPLAPIAQATTAPKSYASGPVDPNAAAAMKDIIAQQHLVANQNDPTSLNALSNGLRERGFNAQTDYTDSNGHTGGILLDGKPFQTTDGSNRWTDLQQWEQASPQRRAPVVGAPLYGATQAPSMYGSTKPTPIAAPQTPAINSTQAQEGINEMLKRWSATPIA